MNQANTHQSTKRSYIKVAQYVIVAMITIILIILIVNLFPSSNYTGTYQPSLVKVSETEWDPLMLSLQFGIQYFLIALLTVGIALSVLFVFSCRDENYTK